MPSKIQLKRSTVAGTVPTTSSLDLGEIGINVADGISYLRQSGSVGDKIIPFITTANAASLSSSFTSSNSVLSQTASYLTPSNNYQITDLTASNAIINGNLTITGSIYASLFSASNIYITSSQLVVTDNIITLNALSPYQRYAGIEMYDSGSGNLSQFLWDGQGDYFFISGSGINSKIIGGPAGQGNLTTGRIIKSSGANIIGDSVINDTGNGIIVDGYISASNITASLFGTSSWSNNSVSSSYSNNSISASYALTASYALNSVGGTSLTTGSTYPITSSWANNVISSSYALTASYCFNAPIDSVSGSFTSSSVWELTHSLNSNPVLVQAYDTDFNQIIPQNILLVNPNVTRISFSISSSGYVIVTRSGLQTISGGGVATTVKSDFVSSTSYIGVAPAGSATSASVWTITKTVFDSAGNISSSTVATNVKWDDRLTATYT